MMKLLFVCLLLEIAFGATGYATVSSGLCTDISGGSRINTLFDCQTAAAKVRSVDASTDSYFASPSKPTGCYYDNSYSWSFSTAKFNDPYGAYVNTGKCGGSSSISSYNTYPCICKVDLAFATTNVPNNGTYATLDPATAATIANFFGMLWLWVVLAICCSFCIIGGIAFVVCGACVGGAVAAGEASNKKKRRRKEEEQQQANQVQQQQYGQQQYGQQQPVQQQYQQQPPGQYQQQPNQQQFQQPNQYAQPPTAQ